jgi:hypothetical protein
VLDADAQQAVLQRAEGNPLYAEEYARMLVEHEGGDLALPETVQGLIAARIDGLAPEEKTLLQDASVIGKVFWPGALPGADERSLHSLERKEFIRRDRRSSIAGETQYAFLHALVRDVAYGQIPRAERAEKHRRAAEWLASLAGDRTEDHAEMLAHHYREALSLAEAARLDTAALREPARRAFAEGARRAFSLGAGGTAYELACDALALTPADSPEQPELHLLAGYAARMVGIEDVEGHVDSAVEGFLANGDKGRAAESAALLSSDHFYRGDVAASRAAAARGVELARAAPPSLATARAIGSGGRNAFILDRDFSLSLELAREALAYAEEAGDEELAAINLNTIGMARVHAGDPRGVEDLERSVERAARGASVFHLHSGLNNLANCLTDVGRLEESSQRLREARSLCERYGFATALVWNDAELVYDSYFRGDLEGAVAWSATFLAQQDAAASGYQLRPVLATRALTLLARGQVDEAGVDAERALSGLRESGPDAQVSSYIIEAASYCRRAAGRDAEADELLAEVFAAPIEEKMYDLPLSLVELGRGDEYLSATEGQAGHSWLEAGRAASAGKLARAAEIYGGMGARFAEARAALLAAERGDTSLLDAALAYFEEQRATPYEQRCRALLQASA